MNLNWNCTLSDNIPPVSVADCPPPPAVAYNSISIFEKLPWTIITQGLNSSDFELLRAVPNILYMSPGRTPIYRQIIRIKHVLLSRYLFVPPPLQCIQKLHSLFFDLINMPILMLPRMQVSVFC